MPTYGFLPSFLHSQFRCVKSAAEEAQFLFCSNEETREVYPYDFELYITYRLFVKNSCQFCAFFCDFHTKACVFQFHKTPSASFHSSTTTVHHSACQYNQKAPEKQNLFSGALFLFLCIICTALIWTLVRTLIGILIFVLCCAVLCIFRRKRRRTDKNF